MMRGEHIEKQAINVILAIVAAVTNYRLYPPTSTMVINTMNRLNQAVRLALEQMDSLIYAEANKKLLIHGEPLSEKDLSRNQIKVLLGMMLDYGIKSVSFHQGLSDQELTEFIKIFIKPSKDIETEGGLTKIITDLGLIHIKIDEKVYVELDSERQMISFMNLTDEDIVRFINGEEAISEAAIEQVRELVKDADWISRVFQAGVKQVLKETGDFITEELSDRFAGMINVLSRISKRERKEISHTIIAALPDMEKAAARTVLMQDLDTVFGRNTFRSFIEELDDDVFHRLLGRVKELAVSISSEQGQSEAQIKAMHRVFQMMTASKKAAGLFSLDQLQALKNEVIQPEERMAKGMDKTIEILMAKGNMPTVLTLIERLGKLLLNKDPKIRSNALKMMIKIDKQLEAAGQTEQRIAISRQLTEWIKLETVMTPEYEKIADQMERMARHLFETDQPDDAEQILEVYYKIHTGQLRREKDSCVIAGKVLRNLATDDLLTQLIRDTRIDGTKKQAEGIPALGMLGSVSIERLLNRLYGTQNRMERNRMIQAISLIGKPAAKPIVERLLQRGPWYYMRNLILVLGRIGTDIHLKVVVDMLEDPDPRIQREAVFAVQNIAGAGAGEILFRYLNLVDDEVKGLIISALGIIRYQPAISSLMDMLDENTPGKNRKIKDEIRVKICEALGRIGDPDAVPALEKIMHSKSFLAIKTHDPAVRAAAAEAMEKLKTARVKTEDATP